MRVSLLLLSCSLSCAAVSVAQTPSSAAMAPRPAVVSGTVLDPSGARVPGARVQLNNASGTAGEATTDAGGQFSMQVAPGSYDLVVLADGFSAFVQHVKTGATKLAVTPKLQVATAAEEVQVDGANGNGVGLSKDDNASAIRLDEAKLSTLSEDDATFQQQLTALAGANGGREPQVYVDGFPGGQIPPKETIREVKINENPYSAEYDSMGMGRMEILTKAGTGKWHGNLAAQGNDSSFNSRNPFLFGTSNLPPYYRVHLRGGASGPLDKKSSLFVNAEYYNQQNNSIINAVTDAGAFSAAVPAPLLTQDYSLRYDRQLTAADSFTARYEWNRSSQTNAGLSQFVLPSAGYNSGTTLQTLQVGDTHLLGAHAEIEGRFQYQRTNVTQDAQNGAPTILVSGSFTGGGSSIGANRNTTEQYITDLKGSWSRGKHFVRFGFRARTSKIGSASTAGFNGTYYFPDIASYVARTPTQVQLTTGQSAFSVSTTDLEEFAEDEWKLGKNFTLDSGFRLESQTAVPDHWDPSPHVGFAWGLGATDKRPAWVVLRGGLAIFYDRFSTGNLLTSVQRANNTAQQSYTAGSLGVVDVTQRPNVALLSATAAPTTTRVSPNLRIPQELDLGIGADIPLGKKGSMSAYYTFERMPHAYVMRNANAPENGVRPLGAAAGERYEFTSQAETQGNFFWTNANYEFNKWLSVWVAENSISYRGDTSGTASFASNSYNLRQDLGQASWARPWQLFSGLNGKLPFVGVDWSTFLVARSGQLFNITTGADNNGDSIYNDRPSYATAASNPANVVKTRWGTFNTQPVAGETVIPINIARAPRFVSLQVSMSRGWHFGPAAAAPATAAAVAGKPAAKVPGRYELRLGFEAQNITNTVDPNMPIGVLSSPNFGKSLGTANSFLTTSSANRTFTLNASFRF